MEFTKNEKKVLKLLISNSKITDSDIATQLGISSQAVGKIRKKLESTVIDSYTINVNYSMLGINIFALAIARLTREGMDKGQLEIESELHKNPNIISIYRIPKVSSTHIIIYGFTDMNELDNFFYSPKMRQQIHQYLETQELYTFSNNSVIKMDPSYLLSSAIDSLGTKAKTLMFEEIERFKNKIGMGKTYVAANKVNNTNGSAGANNLAARRRYVVAQQD
jgi:DNA-binding Lrp family transcriptional regulator